LKLSSLKDLAQEIAKMHDAEIVHGDLTTSNVIVRDNDNQVFLIDFGLGLLKPTLEDKAVDLYVLARAFTSTHPNSDLMVLQELNTSSYRSFYLCKSRSRIFCPTISAPAALEKKRSRNTIR
jgi:TP53 regulating kinase-like protein